MRTPLWREARRPGSLPRARERQVSSLRESWWLAEAREVREGLGVREVREGLGRMEVRVVR